jgi:hypothetical protein
MLQHTPTPAGPASTTLAGHRGTRAIARAAVLSSAPPPRGRKSGRAQYRHLAPACGLPIPDAAPAASRSPVAAVAADGYFPRFCVPGQTRNMRATSNRPAERHVRVCSWRQYRPGPLQSVDPPEATFVARARAGAGAGARFLDNQVARALLDPGTLGGFSTPILNLLAPYH